MYRNKKTFSISKCKIGRWKTVHAALSPAFVCRMVWLNHDAMVLMILLLSDACLTTRQEDVTKREDGGRIQYGCTDVLKV